MLGVKGGGKVKRILIIDDEQRINQMYTMLLSEEGFEVRRASSAQEATNILIREPFDLVLLDIKMPEVDGKAMYEVVREYDHHLKVIVSSVYPIEEQIRHILGASAYHDKAQGVELLVAKVKEVLHEEDCQENSHTGGRTGNEKDPSRSFQGRRICHTRGKRR